MSTELCQACRTAPVALLVDNEEEDCPYRLCQPCALRLETFSLRPREWVHLAAIHGPEKRALGRDFYTAEGQALQPEAPIWLTAETAYPTRAGVEDDPAALLDLTMSLEHLERRPDILAALKALPAETILAELAGRTETYRTVWVHDIALDVCARALGPAAADRVRADDRSNPLLWAKAAAHCLPFDEGFAPTVALLEASRVGPLVSCLLEFRSARVLDWMETQQDWAYPLVWGKTAAFCALSEARAAAWLESGQPLSHFALAALLTLADHPGYGGLLREFHQPQMVGAPPGATLAAALTVCAERERDPSIQQQIATVEKYLVEGRYRQ